ncbi:hypothetical protein [Corynebacterium cystitidis]|uniref:hypothetical protein n=1 Tax=Corynebacterium cystitidis TaxID=35757 RepID=UPI00211DD24F|nr:hypothetical protein [Corynebacterium cystitidis]
MELSFGTLWNRGLGTRAPKHQKNRLTTKRPSETWDVFYPGYYIVESGDSALGAQPVGYGYLKGEGWHFDEIGFNRLARDVEYLSSERWVYQGEPELLIANAYLGGGSAVTVDWESLQSKTLSPDNVSDLPEIIETVTRVLQHGYERANFGVKLEKTSSQNGRPPSVIRDLFTGVVASVIGNVPNMFP